MNGTHHCPFGAVREPRRLAWALLSRAARGPSKTVWQLIERLGVEDAATALATGEAGAEMDPRVLARANPDRAAAELIVQYAGGGRLITPDDPEWPSAHLAALHAPHWGPQHSVGPSPCGCRAPPGCPAPEQAREPCTERTAPLRPSHTRHPPHRWVSRRIRLSEKGIR